MGHCRSAQWLVPSAKWLCKTATTESIQGEWQTCCADVAQLIKGRQDLPGQMGRHGIQGLEGLLTWGVHVLALEQLEDPQLPLPSVLHLLCKSSLCDATVSAE